MSSPRLAKLEALLATVKRNAGLPRSAGPPAAAAPIPSPEVSATPAWDDQTLAADAPPARPEPVPVRPEPVSQIRAAVAPVEDDTSDVDVLLADDIVDITEEEVAEPAAAEAEQPAPSEPPISSRRLIGEEAAPAEREAPAKTPPPESGRQVAAMPALHAPPAAVVTEAEDLEADLGRPAAMPPPRRPMPTLEQLGETVDLEEATGVDLEVEMPAAEEAPGVDELELDLRTGAHSQYDDSLPPPPGAREELAAHLQREAERSAPPPPAPQAPAAPAIEPQRALAPLPPLASAPGPSMPTVPAAAAVAAAVAKAEAALATRPDAVIPRPAPSPAAVEIVERDAPFEPRTFLQLLDASLALGTGSGE